MLLGSVAGDARFTTPELISDRLAAIAANRGLDGGNHFHDIWLQRVLAGSHDIGDARTAMSQEAQRRAATPTGAVEGPTAPGAASDASTGIADGLAGPEVETDLGDHGFATTSRGLTFAPDSHWNHQRVVPTVQMVYDTRTTPAERLEIFRMAAANFPGGEAAFQLQAGSTQRAYALRHAHNVLGMEGHRPSTVASRDMAAAVAALRAQQQAGLAERRYLDAPAFDQPQWDQHGRHVAGTLPADGARPARSVGAGGAGPNLG